MANRGVHLLTYADRLGGDISAVGDLLRGPLSVFSGVHLLPFFTPFDGDDAGFDPVDHTAVDPRLGTWSDVVTLRDAGLCVTADLIVNHVSASSTEFQDWLARGGASRYAGMFLTFDTVFPGGAREADITAFYRPRPGLPFTAYQHADGTRRLVWTTFLPSQVDVDVRHPAGMAYLRRVLGALAEGGVGIVRVDAVGYAIKTPGSDSFMTAQTLEFVRELVRECREAGLEVLVEVHAHHTQQLAIAPLVDWVYDFALPPLLLHAFVEGRIDRLDHWLSIRPTNAITVLDTHDGIGVIDAGPIGDLPGLIDHDEMAAVFEAAARATGGQSEQASVVPQWFTLPHQINSTFPAAVGDPQRYVLARAVQLLVPGLPQVYYVGLLNGMNDLDLWHRTGQGREINRRRYDEAEVRRALDDPVVRAQLVLVRIRSEHPALEGTFHHRRTGEAGLELVWSAGEHRLALEVDVAAGRFRLDLGDGRTFGSVDELAAEWLR